jgi:hypothetical protein
MPHPLLDMLLITEQDCRKAGLTEAEVINRIITDNLVTLRAQALMVHLYSKDVVAAMGPLERERLRKHACPAPKQKTVEWSVARNRIGVWTVVARHTGTGEVSEWRGDGPLANFVFYGEKIPEVILKEFSQRTERDPGVQELPSVRVPIDSGFKYSGR